MTWDSGVPLLSVPIIVFSRSFAHVGVCCVKQVGRGLLVPFSGVGGKSNECRPQRMPSPGDTVAGYGNTVGQRALLGEQVEHKTVNYLSLKLVHMEQFMVAKTFPADKWNLLGWLPMGGGGG